MSPESNPFCPVLEESPLNSSLHSITLFQSFAFLGQVHVGKVYRAHQASTCTTGCQSPSQAPRFCTETPARVVYKRQSRKHAPTGVHPFN